MEKVKLKKLVEKPISGEWGDEDTLGDGINIIRTTNFSKSGIIDYSNLTRRLIQKKNKKGELEIDVEKIESKKLIDEDIIIEKSGGGPNSPVGRVVYFEGKDDQLYLCNNFTAILRPKKNLINARYLFYQFSYLYLIGKVKKYQNQTTGLFNLKLPRYLDVEIKIPNKEQQVLVVAQLNKIQELINERKETIVLLDDYKLSLFLEMFLENPESNKWEFKVISKTKIFESTQYGTALKANDEGNGMPVLRMNNITYSGKISLDNIKWVEFSDTEKEKLELNDRDVLFNRTNSPKLVGKTGVWAEGNGYTFAGYLIRIVLNESLMNPYYFSGYFNSHYGKKVLANKARPSGSMSNLSATTLRKQKILIPPINLQIKYEVESNKISLQKHKYEESLIFLERLFQAKLHNAFSENADINEDKIFEDLIKDFTINDLKKGERIEYLLSWLKKNKFSNIENYETAIEKLLHLLEDGTIKQYISKNNIKIKKG
jgi:type I restriction enzyme S subunit